MYTHLLAFFCFRSTFLSINQSAFAACNLVPTAGNDVYICDSGTGGPLTDPGGNNSLTLPTGGTGIITGPVTFSTGVDTVVINSGTINGDLSEGGGNDSLQLNGGTVNGTIFQNGGVDNFVMTGGVVQRVEQGSELDTATVSGGRIIGQFFAGDFFTMTGGQIGEVNLEQANNEMRMSGGVIDRFVIATQGRDLLILSGGSIGTFVNLGSGDNRIFISGGSIGSTVTTAGGNDQFTWDTAGTIGGAINLGAGNDTGTLQRSHRGNPLVDTIDQWRGRYGYADLCQYDGDDGGQIHQLGKCLTDQWICLHARQQFCRRRQRNGNRQLFDR